MRTVAIVGSAPTTRDLAPFDDPSITIWGINEALAFPWMKRADAMFQMHPRWIFSRANNRNDPNHFEWLKREHPFPIYMQEKFPDIPSSVAYPLKEIVRKFGRRYFTSSVAYMLALAMYSAYDRIEIYGVEMGSNTEYFYQRDCITYWIGRAEGYGIEVYLPKGSHLLQGRLYGYEGNTMLNRQYCESRQVKLSGLVKEAQAKMQAIAARVHLYSEAYDAQPDEERLAQLDKAVQEERERLAEYYALAGALKETEHYLKELDLLLLAAGETGEEPGEIKVAAEYAH